MKEIDAKQSIDEGLFGAVYSLFVVHCKRSKYDVYIGRPSKWGNPFEIGKDGDRKTVIRKYREWLIKQPELLAALPELKGKILGCWCSPKACHGDVLAALANNKINKHQPSNND
jgi:hypothetical protein